MPDRRKAEVTPDDAGADRLNIESLARAQVEWLRRLAEQVADVCEPVHVRPDKEKRKRVPE